MNEDIIKKRENCWACTLIAKENKQEPMNRTVIDADCNQTIAIDFWEAGDVPEKLLVIMDVSSRFVATYFLKNGDAASVRKALQQFFQRYGEPKTLLSDNGPPFSSKEFNEWLQRLGITHKTSSPYFPQQNGMVERFMRNVNKAGRIAKISGLSIMEQIRKMTYLYNHAIHETTNEIPWEIVTRKISTMRLPSAITYTRTVGTSNTMDDESNDEMVMHDLTKKEKGRDYSNKKKGNVESGIKVGDSVVCKDMEPRTKLKSNFRAKLFKVISRDRNEIFVEGADGEICRRDVSAVKLYNAKEVNQSEEEGNASTDPTGSEASTRPKRIIKKPQRYLNMIAYNEEFLINQLSTTLFHSMHDDEISTPENDQEINIEFFK